MARRYWRLMEIIGYILKPEISPEDDRQSGAPANPESFTERVMGHTKTAAWLFMAIMLSIALGQLN